MSTSAPRASAKVPPEIWGLVTAAFFVAIGFGLIAPILPQFASQFSVSVTATTVVVSAFAAFRLLFAPAAGVIVERLGERPTYIIGVLIVAASSAATAFAGSYWHLLLVRSLGGIGSVMFTVSATGMLVRYSPPAIRGRTSALYGSMFLIGNVAGPVFGGLLAGLGLRAPFLIYAATLTVAAGVVAIMLRGVGGGGAARRAQLPPMTVADALAHPTFRASLMSGFANGWTNFGLRNSIVPLFIAFAISKEPWVAGAALAIFAAGNGVVLPYAARITDTVGRRPVIMWGLAINGVFTALLGATEIFWVVMACSALAGMGAGLMNPGQQAAVADVVGNERSGGKVLATFHMAQDVGAILGPVLAGLVVDWLGYTVAFAFSGALMVAAVLPWRRAPETLPRLADDV